MGRAPQRHTSSSGLQEVGPAWHWRRQLSLNATTLPAGPCSGALWLEREPLPSGDAQQMSGFNEISHSVEGLLWSVCHSQQVTSWRLHRPVTLGKVHWTCDEVDKPREVPRTPGQRRCPGLYASFLGRSSICWMLCTEPRDGECWGRERTVTCHTA